MSKHLLEVKNLRIEFPTRRGLLTAIDDVSFHIDEGEVLGVVGESGAGKSLTGAAIIGLLEPPGRVAGGEIIMNGRRIDNLGYEEMRKIRGREIGAIFQDPLTSLNPLYTVGRQLTETIMTHTDMTPTKARERAIELLTEVGIPAPEKRVDQYPHQFSGGMRQRVVIALALCVNPKLVVADEPTTALDVSIQAQIIALLKKLCRDHGTAVMLVTHDMGSIPMIGHTGEKLQQIEGSMPRLTNIPTGCAFNPRCPKSFDRCFKERPNPIDVDGTEVACWLYDKEAAHV